MQAAGGMDGDDAQSPGRSVVDDAVVDLGELVDQIRSEERHVSRRQ